MLRRLAVGLGMAVALAGCGGGSHGKPAGRGDCRTLISASKLVEPALNGLTGIPNSDADALRRLRSATTAIAKALGRPRPASATGAVAEAGSRFRAALRALAREVATARSDLRTGRTEQQRSNGYAATGQGVDEVNAAATAVFAACPTSG